MYSQISTNVAQDKYRDFPRIVGETGGKNFHLIHPSAAINHSALSTLRGAFEYQGQKCSATSRAYVPESIWPDFKDQLVGAVSQISIGNTSSVENLNSFMGPVIHEESFNKLANAIEKAKQDPELEIIIGGEHDKTNGFYVQPTVIKTTNPNHEYLSKEFLVQF